MAVDDDVDQEVSPTAWGPPSWTSPSWGEPPTAELPSPPTGSVPPQTDPLVGPPPPSVPPAHASPPAGRGRWILAGLAALVASAVLGGLVGATVADNDAPASTVGGPARSQTGSGRTAATIAGAPLD